MQEAMFGVSAKDSVVTYWMYSDNFMVDPYFLLVGMLGISKIRVKASKQNLRIPSFARLLAYVAITYNHLFAHVYLLSFLLKLICVTSFLIAQACLTDAVVSTKLMKSIHSAHRQTRPREAKSQAKGRHNYS